MRKNRVRVKFTQNEKFGAATTCFIAKAKAVSDAAISLIYRLKISTFVTYKKLFEPLVNSILLYASPMYDIQYLDELEKIQLQYYKRLMILPSCTQNYAARLDLGIPHIGNVIFKYALSWTINVCNMHETRLPKLCFHKMMSDLAKDEKAGKIKFNCLIII